MMKVRAMIWSTLMPMRRAVSGSSAVARIALPSRVVRMNAVRVKVSSRASPTMNTQSSWMVAPAIWNEVFGNRSGKAS